MTPRHESGVTFAAEAYGKLTGRPAAGFVSHVRQCTDAHTIELNLEPSQGATIFAETVYGPATEVVPAYVEKILDSGW